MATLTKEQLTRWNSKLTNGFQLDVRRYVLWGEKIAARNIQMDGGKVLRATIYWCEVLNDRRYTGQVQPKMHLSIWTPAGNGMMFSSGINTTIELTEKTFSKKVWNELAKFTSEWNDERILAEAGKRMDQIQDPLVV